MLSQVISSWYQQHCGLLWHQHFIHSLRLTVAACFLWSSCRYISCIFLFFKNRAFQRLSYCCECSSGCWDILISRCVRVLAEIRSPDTLFFRRHHFYLWRNKTISPSNIYQKTRQIYKLRFFIYWHRLINPRTRIQLITERRKRIIFSLIHRIPGINKLIRI